MKSGPDPAPLRLDRALVQRGLARSRGHAHDLIAAGQVRVGDQVATRAADLVVPHDVVRAEVDPYVSRAAHKLIGALDDLGLDLPVGLRALDAGASTGGFTQVLLERGCAEVTAVDVGTGQLVAELRNDPRVRVHERTNLRDLTLDHLGGDPVDLVVADVSFISLTLLIEPLVRVVRPRGSLVLMVKPQFEVGRDALGAGAVVRDPTLQRAAVAGLLDRAATVGWHARGAVPSRLPGGRGNREFFVWLRHGRPDRSVDLDRLVRPSSR